jgi:hypothetical protein
VVRRVAFVVVDQDVSEYSESVIQRMHRVWKRVCRWNWLKILTIISTLLAILRSLFPNGRGK